MTRAEILGLLNRHSYVEDEIRECVERMQNLAELTLDERDIKATLLSGMPGNTSTVSDPTYQKAQKILDGYRKEIARIERRQRGLFEERALVDTLMDALTPEERKVITLRYFRKYRWWMVAQRVCYTERQCYNLRDSALEKMSKL